MNFYIARNRLDLSVSLPTHYTCNRWKLERKPKGKNMSALTPIAPQYAANGPTTLILKEKKFSLSGDSATIKDSDGNTLFKINASLPSLSERRFLSDASGNELGQVRKKRFSPIHSSCYLGPMNDEKKIMISAKGVLNPLNSNAIISMNGQDVGEVAGNWRAKQYTITIGGMEAAKISRKTNAASLFLDADSYCLEVQHGVDMVFMSMVTIALDEIFHD